MKKNKLAIACQGGGSQTAFTAGVLISFFENDIQQKKQIVSLSGTSGGAVCAALAWYSLLKASKGDTQPLGKRLINFWNDNTTQNIYEAFLNDYLINYLRVVDGGWLPRWEASPSSPFVKAFSSFFTAIAPNKLFYDFRKLLEAHIDFAEIASWDLPQSPALLIGAANVKKGEFKKFSSLKGEIRVEALMASAAVPTIFPAVEIDNEVFWDGLFSDNPPTDELLFEELVGADNKPDELWIIQINPKECDEIPVSSQDIIDRRNEMIGNASLLRDVQKIELINRFLEAGAFTEDFRAQYKHIEPRFITMSPGLAKKLDYPSKLDRNQVFITELIQDGRQRGLEFIEQLEA